MTRISAISCLRRAGLLFVMLMPLAACNQQPSPWENMHYSNTPSSSSDESI